MSDMNVVKLRTIEDLLKSFHLIHQMYPSMSSDQYKDELASMIKNGYFQIAVISENQIIGVSGVWIGSKLWSGRYLELDNIIVHEDYRSKGVGKLLFDTVKEIAIKEHCNVMALDSYTDNFEAHKFFYNQGFIPRGFHFINILNKENMRS